MNETCENAEKFLSEIVADLGFDLTVEARWTDEGCLLNLSGEDSHFALAENGELLDALEVDCIEAFIGSVLLRQLDSADLDSDLRAAVRDFAVLHRARICEDVVTRTRKYLAAL